jgi:amidase
MSICFDSALDLASSIKTGRLPSTEVLEAHLQQIDEFNPGLNAVVTLDADGARARARQADEALSRGQVWRPLHGVPFTLKDAFATAGVRTTSGFQPFAGYFPLQDSILTNQLKTAGGILRRVAIS